MTSFESDFSEPGSVEKDFSDYAACESCPMLGIAQHWIGVHTRSNTRIANDFDSGVIEKAAQKVYKEMVINAGTGESYEDVLQEMLISVGRHMERSDRALKAHEADIQTLRAMCTGVVRAIVFQDEQDGGETEFTFISCGSPSLPGIDDPVHSRAVVVSRRRIS